MGSAQRDLAASTSAADRLADAAIAVIARDGFDALSVRAVAREAAVTGGTVQHHFPTKAELVAAALDRTVQRQKLRIASAAPGVDDACQIATALCALVPFDDASREDAVVWIAMSAAVTGSRFVAERRRVAVDATRAWLAEAIRSGQRAGRVDGTVDPVVTAPLLEAAVDGVMLQAISEDADHAELCARVRDLVGAILDR